MKQYIDALKLVMEKGIDRPDRTGIGSRAYFGIQTAQTPPLQVKAFLKTK